MRFEKLTKGMLLAATVLLSACGGKGGFSTELDPVTNVADEGRFGGGDGGSVTAPPAEEANLKGFVSGGTNDGQQVLSFDPVTGEFLLMLPLGKNITINLLSTEFPDLPGTRLYTHTGSDGSKYLALAIPLRYVLRDVALVNRGRLPNGDPLPDMPAGEMPVVGMAFNGSENVKVYLYVGMDAVGLFIESSFNPYIGIGWDIVSQTQQKIGIFALVPKKGEHQGGFFLGIHLDDRLARMLDKFIR